MTNWEEFKAKSLEDVGTRYQHYSDLVQIWEEAIEVIEGYVFKDKRDKERLDLLTRSLEMLKNTLDGMEEYSDRVLMLRKLIDWIPNDPAVIPEGRGTPLQRRLGDGNES